MTSNYIDHAWPIANGEVHLVVQSRTPLPATAYYDIVKLIEAGDEFASSLPVDDTEPLADWEKELLNPGSTRPAKRTI